MALSAQKIEDGLLAHNFFPRVAKRGDEFPPCFVSVDFTSAIASKLIALPLKRNEGYGAVEARSTRYDLAPRRLEISHPRAFAPIARHLKSSWKEWKFVVSNPSSAIRVSEHPDGRIFSMVTSADSESLSRPGGRFLATVDVTNFYGSIYTHSFPWAVHGIHVAKANQGNKRDWANNIDLHLRNSRRKETTGISAGPGTSAVVGEIILGKVDSSLREKGYEFIRFIDDYFYVGSTRDEAEAFIRAVRDALGQLKLAINPRKTTILELPQAVTPRWLRSLRRDLRGEISAKRLLDVLDEAIEGSEIDPEDGALRYVLVGIEEIFSLEDVPFEAREVVVDRLLNIGYLRPIAIGTACRLLGSMGNSAVADRKDTLELILQEHASALRTDAITWILYTVLRHGLSISTASAKAITRAGDCLALTLLAEDEESVGFATEFIEALEMESPPNYRRDEYWLLYYQLALSGKKTDTVPTAYSDEFQPLLEAGVSFINLDAENPYEPLHGRSSKGPSAGTGSATPRPTPGAGPSPNRVTVRGATPVVNRDSSSAEKRSPFFGSGKNPYFG